MDQGLQARRAQSCSARRASRSSSSRRSRSPIGANTAIFSVVNAVLLEPLPYPERRSARAHRRHGARDRSARGVRRSRRTVFRDTARARPALEDIGLYGTGSSTTRAEGHVDQLFVTQATPSFFTTLGAQPLHGRLPTDKDDANVVVISHWLWRTLVRLRSGGDRQELHLRRPEPHGHRRHAAGIPLSGRARRVLGADGDSRRAGRRPAGSGRARSRG